MKFMKKRNYEGSLRKVWSDDKEVCFGVVGTVGEQDNAFAGSLAPLKPGRFSRPPA